MLNKKYESGSHFPFSSNISESVSWLARSEQCFPSFIFSVKNRERVPGSRREIGEMNHPSLLNTNLPSPLKHWLSTRSSHHLKLTENFHILQGRKSNWTLDIIVCWCWCESKTLLWICQVCVNIPHFVLHQNFFPSLLLLGPWLLLTLSFLSAQCTTSPAEEDGGRWVEGIFLVQDFSNIFETRVMFARV